MEPSSAKATDGRLRTRTAVNGERVGASDAMNRYQPMKAVLTDGPFSDPQWLFERKLDGERCGALRERGRVRLISRSGQVLDDTYPELVDALQSQGPDLLVDGEVVAFKGGQTSF